MVLFAPAAVVAALVMLGTFGSNQDDNALPQAVPPAQTTALVDLTTTGSATVESTESPAATEPQATESMGTEPMAIRANPKPKVSSGQTTTAAAIPQPAAPQVTSTITPTKTTTQVTVTTTVVTTVPKTTTTTQSVARTTPRTTETPKPTKTSPPPHHPKRR